MFMINAGKIYHTSDGTVARKSEEQTWETSVQLRNIFQQENGFQSSKSDRKRARNEACVEYHGNFELRSLPDVQKKECHPITKQTKAHVLMCICMCITQKIDIY